MVRNVVIMNLKKLRSKKILQVKVRLFVYLQFLKLPLFIYYKIYFDLETKITISWVNKLYKKKKKRSCDLFEYFQLDIGKPDQMKFFNERTTSVHFSITHTSLTHLSRSDDLFLLLKNCF